MSDSVVDLSVEEWESIFERFNASDLSQAAFCREEQLSRFAFSYRYQRSAQFRGKRRGPRAGRARSSKGSAGSTFAAVSTRKSTVPPATASSSAITLHIAGVARIECPAEFALAAISQLVREVRP